jgi:hypothetical protein
MLRIISIVVLVSVAVAFIWMLPPHCSTTARQRGSDTEFDIATRGINGLLGLRIWRADTRETLWDVNLNYYPGPKLAYGEVPADFETFNGAQNSARQNFPPDDQKPMTLPINSQLFVEVDCQYDHFISAACRCFYFLISTDEHGNLSEVQPVNCLTPSEYPKPN